MVVGVATAAAMMLTMAVMSKERPVRAPDMRLSVRHTPHESCFKMRVTNSILELHYNIGGCYKVTKIVTT